MYEGGIRKKRTVDNQKLPSESINEAGPRVNKSKKRINYQFTFF